MLHHTFYFVILLTIALSSVLQLVTVVTADWCDNSYRINGTISPSPQFPVSTINDILKGHNDARRAVSPWAKVMPMMVWDQAIATHAANYITKCPGFEHSSMEYRMNAANCAYLGENLAGGMSDSSYGNTTAGKTIVKAWLGELTSVPWKYGCHPFMSGAENCNGAGHYTQCIKDTATRIGCASAYCPGQQLSRVWVCMYCGGAGRPPQYSNTSNPADASPCQLGLPTTAAAPSSPPATTTSPPSQQQQTTTTVATTAATPPTGTSGGGGGGLVTTATSGVGGGTTSPAGGTTSSSSAAVTTTSQGGGGGSTSPPGATTQQQQQQQSTTTTTTTATMQQPAGTTTTTAVAATTGGGGPAPSSQPTSAGAPAPTTTTSSQANGTAPNSDQVGVGGAANMQTTENPDHTSGGQRAGVTIGMSVAALLICLGGYFLIKRKCENSSGSEIDFDGEHAGGDGSMKFDAAGQIGESDVELVNSLLGPLHAE